MDLFKTAPSAGGPLQVHERGVFIVKVVEKVNPMGRREDSQQLPAHIQTFDFSLKAASLSVCTLIRRDNMAIVIRVD